MDPTTCLIILAALTAFITVLATLLNAVRKLVSGMAPPLLRRQAPAIDLNPRKSPLTERIPPCSVASGRKTSRDSRRQGVEREASLQDRRSTC